MELLSAKELASVCAAHVLASVSKSKQDQKWRPAGGYLDRKQSHNLGNGLKIFFIVKPNIFLSRCLEESLGIFYLNV